MSGSAANNTVCSIFNIIKFNQYITIVDRHKPEPFHVVRFKKNCVKRLTESPHRVPSPTQDLLRLDLMIHAPSSVLRLDSGSDVLGFRQCPFWLNK